MARSRSRGAAPGRSSGVGPDILHGAPCPVLVHRAWLSGAPPAGRARTGPLKTRRDQRDQNLVLKELSRLLQSGDGTETAACRFRQGPLAVLFASVLFPA